MIIRELTTLLNFDLDESKLHRYTQDLEAAKGLANEAGGSIARAAQQLGGALQGIGTRLSLFVTAPIAAIGAMSIKTAADMEQLQIAYKTLLGSAEKGAAFTQELLKFAAATPFEFEELTQYSKLLLAARIEADQIIPTLSMMGDITSLVGREKLPFMMRALIDVKNKTKLTGEELRQFVNAGVALVPMLSDTMGKSTAEISDMMRKGAISYDDVVKVLKDATSKGGKYFQGMSSQVGTLNQLLSNVADAFYQFRIELGKILIKELHLSIITKGFIAVLNSLTAVLKAMPGWMRKVLVVFGLLLIAIGPVLVLVGSLIAAFGGLYIQAMALNILLGGTLLPMLGGLAAGFGAVLLTIAGLVIVVVAIYLAFDDLFAWLDGKESVLGDIFGPFQDILTKGLDFSYLLKTFQIFFDDLGAMYDKFKQTPVGNFLTWITGLQGVANIAGALGTGAGRLESSLPTVTAQQVLSPAAYAALTRGGAGNASTVTVQSSINVSVPEGTPEGQRNYVEKAAQNAVQEAWDKHLRNTFRQYQLAE